MMTAVFSQFAAYNRWANARLYAAALALPDEAYRRPIGVFFGSLHGTLNHLLVTDRLWLRRLTGEGEHPDRLNAIIHDDRNELARARSREDERLISVVEAYSDSDLERAHGYRTTSGQPHEQRIADILQHLFNHQTHHRGQAHACCSILTGKEPPSLDLLAFQRGAPAPSISID
ncbi:DinB family protein [Bradyrhizobium xenonodulans]|uniref:DinB family protein n=2 Tax=Bradyrhizobium xenonodulans TaxID=2736875 RepID=A0ABY7MSN9_9BRAD|nr:DinB family protein [Bradyrhizobium xenonodulans]